eukprot:225013_1
MAFSTCLVLILSTVCRSQSFTVKNPPKAVGQAACATYDNSILMMGGSDKDDPHKTQLLEYNILSDVMVDHADVLPHKANGIGVYYGQYGNSLYMIASATSEHSILVYDLSSPLFPSEVSIIQNGTSNIFGVAPCLTVSQHFLFVLGGYESGYLRIMHVLSLPDHVWSLGPEMINTRTDAGCVVMTDNYLYAIGGMRNVGGNERIFLDNFQNQQWQSIESLTEVVSHPGIAPFEDVIWVFGGRDYSDPFTYWHKIWNIYTSDGSVALLSESLPYAFTLQTGTMAIVSNVVYLFDIDQSIKYVIPSSQPTKQPTPNPTQKPTTNPTNHPSPNPTKKPTKSP